jgi:sugar-specific transcriptional regulator TrmB
LVEIGQDERPFFKAVPSLNIQQQERESLQNQAQEMRNQIQNRIRELQEFLQQLRGRIR